MILLTDVVAVIHQLLPEPHAGLLAGILFGAKANLNPELKEALIRSGTLHIVALSGMNITILSSLTATTLLRVFSRKITSLLTISIIIGFVLFVGVSPSVVRAAIMGCLSLLSTTLGRQRQALFLLLLTGSIMLIIYPPYITDISFQLSFLATLGLILFGKKQELNTYDNLRSVSLDGSIKQPKPVSSTITFFIFSLIKDDLRTTLAAQVFTIPIFVFEFHRLSLLSPLANVLIGWIIVPLTVAGLFLCLAGLVWVPFAVPIAWVVWIMLEYLLTIIFSVSSLPFSSIDW